MEEGCHKRAITVTGVINSLSIYGYIFLTMRVLLAVYAEAYRSTFW